MKDKQDLLKILNSLDPDRLTKGDFGKVVRQIFIFLQKVNSAMTSQMSALKQNLVMIARKEVDSMKGNIMDECGSMTDTKIKKNNSEMSKMVDNKVTSILVKKDEDKEEMIMDMLGRVHMPEQKETLLDTPMEIRNKLEVLSGDERLSMKAIDGLMEALEELRKKGSKTFMGGGGGGAGKVVRAYDLSSQLNGVLKTFTLPAFYRVLSVQSSSFPYGSARPTTDYTTDASAMTITFTSEIDASTTLAEGQSLLVLYSEA